MKLAGAGHLLAAHPEDPSTARGFLETPTDADPDRLREVLADVVTTFLRRAPRRRPVRQGPAGAASPSTPRPRSPTSVVARRTTMFKNFWYAVEFSDDVKPGKPMKVKVLGQQLVLYRKTSDNSVVAMSDLCVHRGAALSGGDDQGRLHRLSVPRLGVQAER